jgi:sec-independent protein translocase protein TatA
MDPVLFAGLLGLGGPELIAVAILAVVLFGGKKVGELGKGLGEGIKNFKTAIKSDEEKLEDQRQALKREEERLAAKKQALEDEARLEAKKQA